MHLLGAFFAAFIAGAINSVAGGGSMISFPILLALGLPPLYANATNTVGIWPGAFGSLWGFREELARVPKSLMWILIPAFFGSIGGALLLKVTSPELFERIVPGLILFATVLFMIAPPIRERLRRMRGEARTNVAAVFVLQLLVAVYGGYFGAGMSILMLSVLSLMGMKNMLEMTAMTSLLSLVINGMAGLIFALSGLVEWNYILVMWVGAIIGAYGAAGLARRVGGVWIRRFVILVGLVMSVVMLIKILR